MRTTNSEVSRKKIPDTTSHILWGVSAGRCELCNRILYQNQTYGLTGNYAQIAHIHAVSENGPRNVSEMTKKELNDINNLMLLCYDDHKMIDSDPSAFSGGYLLDQKRKHEERIRNATGISADQSCRILTYNCGILENADLFHDNLLRQALLFTGKLPLQAGPIVLAKNTDLRYKPTAEGFTKKAIELEQSFRYWNENCGLTQDALAVFAFAPMPLLMKLGVLLGDRKNVMVFQCHRQGHKWAWPSGRTHNIKFYWTPTTPISQGKVALVLDLSARMDDARITRVLGKDVTIYHVTIDDPNRDFVASENIQNEYIRSYRNAIEHIKRQHPTTSEIHVFPLLPNSLAIRSGMDYMPKTDPTLVIYEQASQRDGFFEALRIGGTI